MKRELAELRAREIVEDLSAKGIKPKCHVCRRPLKAPVAIVRGCGPKCWKRDRIQMRLLA
jgi:hypothetical protein